MGESGPKGKPDAYRWVVLSAFMGPSIVAQMLWITFAALPTCSTAVLCPTGANETWLTAIYPFVFFVISIPVGYLVDLRGFRSPVIVGAALLAASGLLRPFAPTFPLLLAVQGVGAVGQPFILNSISKLVRGWFPASEVATATGVGTLSIFIGIALGLGLTPVLAEGWGIPAMFELYGVIALLAFLLFAAVARDPPGARPREAPPTLRAIVGMLRVRNIVLLSALFFAGIGIFNSFATYVEPMLEARSVPLDLAGILGGGMILGGIVGAVVLSVVSDRYHTLRTPLLAALGVSAILWALLGIVSGTVPELLVLIAVGFCFMATLPLGLELAARSVPPSSEGAANALVWEFSQIGGTVLIFVFEGVGQGFGWTPTFFLAAVMVAVMLVLGLATVDK